MRSWLPILSGFLFTLLISFSAKSALSDASADREFSAHGIVEALNPDKGTIVIRHGVITNFMPAMTMPFRVKEPDDLAGLRQGDEIKFQLHVTETRSWVDHLSRTGAAPLPAPANHQATQSGSKHQLLRYPFTNELGQSVSLSDFPGQALAITFFYTRCPLPDYCPRLSRNFEEASQKLKTMTGAPTNWHFLSISFDPEFDSSEILRAYGRSYQYDPAHWSFLTGPPDEINELARSCGVTARDKGGTINHNFRTLIVDASGHLQMVFPTTGDLSDQIVAEIIKAAGITNRLAEAASKR